MAAKRKKKASIRPWLLAAVAVLITLVAAISLLSDRRLSIASSKGKSRGMPAEVIPADRPFDHDRDQIDQKSREALRELLRAESDSQ